MSAMMGIREFRAVQIQREVGKMFLEGEMDISKRDQKISETSPQAKRHKPSLLFTSLTTLTSLTFITIQLSSLVDFHH